MLRTRAELIQNGWKELPGWRERTGHKRFIFDKDQYVTDDESVIAVFYQKQSYMAVRKPTKDGSKNEVEAIVTLQAYYARKRKAIKKEPPWLEVKDWEARKGWEYFVDEAGNRITNDKDPNKSTQIFKQESQGRFGHVLYKAVTIIKDENNIEISRDERKVKTKNTYEWNLRQVKRNDPNRQENQWIEVIDWQTKKDKSRFVFENGITVRAKLNANEYVTAIYKRKFEHSSGYEYKATIAVMDANDLLIPKCETIIIRKYTYDKQNKQASQEGNNTPVKNTVKIGIKRKRQEESEEEGSESTKNSNDIKSSEGFDFPKKKRKVDISETSTESESQEPANMQDDFDQPLKQQSSPDLKYLSDDEDFIEPPIPQTNTPNITFFQPAKSSSLSQIQIKADHNTPIIIDSSSNSSEDSSDEFDFPKKTIKIERSQMSKSSEHKESANKQDKLDQPLQQQNLPDLIYISDEEISQEPHIAKAKNTNLSYFQPTKLSTLSQKIMPQASSTTTTTTTPTITIKKSKQD